MGGLEVRVSYETGQARRREPAQAIACASQHRWAPTIVDAIPDTGLRKLEGHEGEEFLLVLEGSIVFFMQDYAPLQMSKGDSVYFDASMPHAYYGVTQPARFLSIVSRTRG
jgi:glyoxylate utilization-related uncharacterized protein